MASDTPTDLLKIIVQQGADFDLEHTYQDAAGNPIDLTGCEAVMQIKSDYDVATPSLEASTYNGYITIDGPNGTITIDIPASETRNLTLRTGVHDLILIWPSGDIDRLVQGNMELSLGVTLTWQTS